MNWTFWELCPWKTTLRLYDKKKIPAPVTDFGWIQLLTDILNNVFWNWTVSPLKRQISIIYHLFDPVGYLGTIEIIIINNCHPMPFLLAVFVAIIKCNFVSLVATKFRRFALNDTTRKSANYKIIQMWTNFLSRCMNLWDRWIHIWCTWVVALWNNNWVVDVIAIRK